GGPVGTGNLPVPPGTEALWASRSKGTRSAPLSQLGDEPILPHMPLPFRAPPVDQDRERVLLPAPRVHVAAERDDALDEAGLRVHPAARGRAEETVAQRALAVARDRERRLERVELVPPRRERLEEREVVLGGGLVVRRAARAVGERV